jgi:hypothetical protein
MKVTDIFTLYHRDNPPPPAGKDTGIRPVVEVEKISLHPGQLFRGEVLGEDGKGHTLLKVGGEIISTRGLLSMTVGQQLWVEVKEVGDSPLFALASAKGAIHELLRSIMEVRPAVLAPSKGDAVPPEFQVAPAPVSATSFVPKLTPIQPDGTLPRETIQLFKALLALPKIDVPLLPEPKMQQLTPFLTEGTGRVDLRPVLNMLNQEGKIPPVFSELAPMRPLFVFSGEGANESIGQRAVFTVETRAIDPGGLPMAGNSVEPGISPSSIPVVTGDGQVVSHAVQVVRSLVDTVPYLPQFANQQSPPSMDELTKGFTDLLRSIIDTGRIPERLTLLEPVKQLLQVGVTPGLTNTTLQAMTADELILAFSQTSLTGTPLSPVEQNETVAKILSSLQGQEPKPELLKTLRQLLSASQLTSLVEAEDGGGKEGHSAGRHDSAAGLTKASSFFNAHTLVNHEIAQATQTDYILIPCFFAGQSGWGEWLWSHEQSGEGQGESHENLAFFLEMSNLGSVSIQAILGEKSFTGQFKVTDDTAYQAISKALPQLEERLNSLGYRTNLTCSKKNVAIMQEIKDVLESKTNDSTPSALVDVRA